MWEINKLFYRIPISRAVIQEVLEGLLQLLFQNDGLSADEVPHLLQIVLLVDVCLIRVLFALDKEKALDGNRLEVGIVRQLASLPSHNEIDTLAERIANHSFKEEKKIVFPTRFPYEIGA